MPRDESIPVALHVPGLYAKIRAKELKLALAPDPRLYFVKVDPVLYRAALATAPKYIPTVLYQVDELIAWKPVTFPRWWLGGRMVPGARGWEPYDSRRYDWFILSPDDTLVPTDPPDLYRD
jgi:hypothetical protein